MALVPMAPTALVSSLDEDLRVIGEHIRAVHELTIRMETAAALLVRQATLAPPERVPDAMSVGEVAQRLSISATHVRELIDRGELTARRLDRRLLILGESYAAFYQRLRTEGV